MAEVERHKTAIARQHLSAPLQAVARHGLLEEGRTIFDYGCGRGDDVSALQAAGYAATGWDPYYYAKAERSQADIVNLGYVLNVIETPAERADALLSAFKLAKQCLVVSVLVIGKADTSALTPYGDGHVTRTGTFQKYFSQSEAQDLIQDTLGLEALPVAPGIFFVFRDKILEQRFLTSRHRRARDISHLLHLVTSSSAEATAEDRHRIEAHKNLLGRIWEAMLALGRLPAEEELSQATAKEIADTFGSFREAGRLAQLAHDPESMKEARASRMADLKVYFALNLFNRRQPYQELPSELQRDIKAFYGSHKNAVDAGKELLFSLSDPEVIHEACEEAEAQGFGCLDGEHSLQLHTALIERLSPTLRAYIGCAEKLYGDATEADLVKIHIQSGKLTLLHCDRFFDLPIPRITERIKIKLREREIDFFEYNDKRTAPRIYLKSRFMTSSQKHYNSQSFFDRKLQDMELFDFSDHGPRVEDFVRVLKANNLIVYGFDIVPRDAIKT